MGVRRCPGCNKPVPEGDPSMYHDEDDEEADGEELDSCWGFFGLDYCMEEAKDVAKNCAERRTAADAQYLNYCAV